MDRYYRSVGHNCNLLLNANPDPDGLIPEPDRKRYQEFGDEVRLCVVKSSAAPLIRKLAVYCIQGGQSIQGK